MAKARLGSGARFDALAAELDRRGVRDPKALAASIGRKKYGSTAFQHMAAKGPARKAAR